MKTFSLPNNSQIAVSDIFDPLPDFMLQADCLFVDPPYNQTLYTNFNSRAEVTLSKHNTMTFDGFTQRVFECVTEIRPSVLFLEIGKEHLSSYFEECKARYRYVTFYNSTYYRKKENKCYVIHSSQDFKTSKYKELEDMDEEDIIAWICKNHPFECIGDLCMGTGLVGKHAFLNGRRFVGTELNPKRLALLVDFIKQKERGGV